MRELSASKKQMMLTEQVPSLIVKMAVPTITAQLITTIYNLVDTYFVSTIGTNAMAAVGVNSSLERTITLLGSLIGSGACSYIARLLGAKKDKDANHVLSTSFFVGLALGLLLAAIGTVFITPLVNLLGATDDCRGYSIQYATYVLYAAPFMIGSFILNMCLRSEGSAKLAMIGIGFGGILNCVLDPLFIYELDLGVAGASMATAISKTVSFCILLYPYIRKKCAVQIALKQVLVSWKDVREVLSIGSTSFLRSCFGVIAGILINRVAGGFSTAALAALSLANRVMEFPFAVILGFGQGYQPVVGFNWGAKQKRRVKESLSFATRVSLIGAAVVGVLLFVFAHVVVNVFNSEADEEVLRLGMLCIRLQCITLPIHAWLSLVNMFYAGIGKAGYALALSTARQGYCFLPVLWLLPMVLGVNGLAATQAVADLLTLAVIIPLCRRAYRLADALPAEGEIDQSGGAVR
jgi:putative MATE family efflux protein